MAASGSPQPPSASAKKAQWESRLQALQDELDQRELNLVTAERGLAALQETAEALREREAALKDREVAVTRMEAAWTTSQHVNQTHNRQQFHVRDLEQQWEKCLSATAAQQSVLSAATDEETALLGDALSAVRVAQRHVAAQSVLVDAHQTMLETFSESIFDIQRLKDALFVAMRTDVTVAWEHVRDAKRRLAELDDELQQRARSLDDVGSTDDANRKLLRDTEASLRLLEVDLDVKRRSLDAAQALVDDRLNLCVTNEEQLTQDQRTLHNDLACHHLQLRRFLAQREDVERRQLDLESREAACRVWEATCATSALDATSKLRQLRELQHQVTVDTLLLKQRETQQGTWEQALHAKEASLEHHRQELAAWCAELSAHERAFTRLVSCDGADPPTADEGHQYYQAAAKRPASAASVGRAGHHARGESAILRNQNEQAQALYTASQRRAAVGTGQLKALRLAPPSGEGRTPLPHRPADVRAAVPSPDGRRSSTPPHLVRPASAANSALVLSSRPPSSSSRKSASTRSSSPSRRTIVASDDSIEVRASCIAAEDEAQRCVAEFIRHLTAMGLHDAMVAGGTRTGADPTADWRHIVPHFESVDGALPVLLALERERDLAAELRMRQLAASCPVSGQSTAALEWLSLLRRHLASRGTQLGANRVAYLSVAIDTLKAAAAKSRGMSPESRAS